VRPSKNPNNETPSADESTGFSLLQSLAEDGVGSVDVINSVSARPTQPSPAVQELSQKLRAVLGGVSCVVEA
jgi:hypothetical protein